MRILDCLSDKSLNTASVYLTVSEAKELSDILKVLLKKPLNNHEHLSTEDLEKEITICIYDPDRLDGFNERSVNLIKNDL